MCVYIYIYIHHIFFVHSSVNGHLGCFHVLLLWTLRCMYLFELESSPNICLGVGLPLNAEQYDRTQICTGRMPGSDWHTRGSTWQEDTRWHLLLQTHTWETSGFQRRLPFGVTSGAYKARTPGSKPRLTKPGSPGLRSGDLHFCQSRTQGPRGHPTLPLEISFPTSTLRDSHHQSPAPR